MLLQNALMKYDPITGEEKPYPSHAEQYRNYHGKLCWIYNPWTGIKRNAGDIYSDPESRQYVYISEPIFNQLKGNV